MKITFVLVVSLLFFMKTAIPCSQDKNLPYVEFDMPFTVWLTEDERELLAQYRDTITEAPAYQSIYQQAVHALDKEPSPIETIYYEGHVSNHPDRVRSALHLQDMKDIRALTWVYLITHEKRFAEKAIEFISAWAGVYKPKGNDVNENKLNFCFYAYDSLKHLMNADQKENIKEWLHDIGQSLLDKWPGDGASNRHMKRLKVILLASLSLNNPQWKQFVIDKTKPVLEASLLPDGTTRDLHHRDSMHYNISSLSNLFKLAYFLRIHDINLYTYQTANGASLKKCIEFIVPYIQGEKVYKEWVNSKVELDRKRWESGDPYYRPGKPWNPAEAYDMLVIASVFHPEYIQLAQLAREHDETLPPSFAERILSIVNNRVQKK